MRHALASILVLVLSLASSAGVRYYDVSMRLKVPRVYDNTLSLGYRRYQTQRLVGTLRVSDTDGEPELSLGLENRTHKINGRRVTYLCEQGAVRWHVIGNNRTGKFKRTSVHFTVVAEPSYNVGDVDEDNTLVITLAGSGSEKSIHGYVAGMLGCGCRAYGHVSPTRIMWNWSVVDTAAVYGHFTLRLSD